MRTSRDRNHGQTFVLVLIVLALLGGGYWLLLSSRNARIEDANRFAREASERLVVNRDARFLNERLTAHAQVYFPPSWRDRFFDGAQTRRAEVSRICRRADPR